jgi:hypothetical protein
MSTCFSVTLIKHALWKSWWIKIKNKKNIYNVSQLGMLAVASFTIFTRVTWKHYNKQIKRLVNNALYHSFAAG